MTLALREIHDNVTLTRDTATAWYVLSPQRWSFTTDGQRETLVTTYGSRLARLTGRRVHIRVTSRPYAAKKWAENLHNATHRPLPEWRDHLADTQRHIIRQGVSEKVVFVGVDVKTRSWVDRAWAWAGQRAGARFEVEDARDAIAAVTEIVGSPGMDGRPARIEEIEWLIHRSIRVGFPAPMVGVTDDIDWWERDIPAFTAGVTYTYTKHSPTVAVTLVGDDGTPVTRHVAVLTVGRMPTLKVPQTSRDPWMQHADRFAFPLEWASTFDVVDGPTAARSTERKRLGIRDLIRQYRTHDLDAPISLAKKADHALRIEDETREGSPTVASRAYGWHRIAVAGDTEADCLRNVRLVRQSYEKHHQIQVEHPYTMDAGVTQARMLMELIPGEPVASKAYRRELTALHVAAGLPHVSAAVGDHRGPFIGLTAGASRRAVTYDPHYPMEEGEASGLTAIVGTLGAGKSILLSVLAYESAMRGITTTILDPSGPLANLTQVPRLAAHSRHLDLVRGDDGVLNPYSVIGDPDRANYDTDDKWRRATAEAAQSRKALAADILTMLVPSQIAALPLTPLVILDAIRRVVPDRTASLWDVVTQLEADARNTEHAVNVANFLRDVAEMPQARLFFPNTVRDLDETVGDTLLVLTLQGLELPSGEQPRETWSTAERLGVPLLHLASHYTTSRGYALARSERKMIALDEAGMVGQWGSGKALFNRLGRDTRKWNISAPIASQNAADILGLNVANYVATAFVGRTEDDEAAKAALRLLRVPPDVGYEKVLAKLSPHVATGRRGSREFIMRDFAGRVEKIQVTLDHQPGLLTEVNTTPEIPVMDTV